MKAILVIDKPKNCDVCQLMHSYYDHDYGWIKECVGSGVNDCIVFGRKLEDYCPLKPMPQRKIVGEIEKVDDFMKSDIQIINEKVSAKIMLDTELLIASGYNLCIDEILGEE